jgi:catechol 2,3-dioxygenase-like lactoylglutathione lyase family enzyme
VGVRMDHHVALRVRDMDASVKFWTEALGGTLATPIALRTGGYFDDLFGQGAQVKICYITFDAAAVELFEFVEPRVEMPVSVQTVDALMHFGVTVDDVPATLAKVEALGGKRRLPVSHVGGRPDAPRFVYCESPDGHVFELMEMTVEQTILEIHKNIAQMEKEIR